MADLLVSDPEDGVVTLTLNRPDKKNALSVALRDEVTEAIHRCGADEAVRCVVITGAGDTFCAGFDLGEFSVDDAAFGRQLWESSDRFHHALLRFPLPLVAAVNGAALAGGFDLAVLCDLRVASSSARFSHPERAFGDVVYGPLRELVGGAVARDLCLTARTVDAEESLRIGLVSRVVAPGELLATALAMARDIAAFPREFTMRTKAKIIRHAGVDPAAPTLDL
ncbi:MAG TPA: enoyl-CoA hydratase/isomerase family protein [Acidimicrobiales bacterium]|nr:enoyl-CoA hydratase/isomerase family protein [Acidimicrobiales bacterium]